MPELFDNRYRFVKDLGKGGFGKVFLAKEERSENLVAIKQLKNEDKAKQDDIIYEMQMVSKFNHPNIVLYKHHFVQDDLLYIVMEYCPLGSLKDLMRNEKITSTFVWKWMSELTETLQLVHEKEIIHHDIKPDNILVTSYDWLMITDLNPIKPVVLVDDNLKYYNMYFGDLNNNTRCYVAPERWISPG